MPVYACRGSSGGATASRGSPTGPEPLRRAGAGAGAAARALGRRERGAGPGGQPGRGARHGQDPAPDRIPPPSARQPGHVLCRAVSLVWPGDPVPPGARHPAAGCARSPRATMPKRAPPPSVNGSRTMDVVAAEDVALVLQVLDLPVAPESLASLHPQARKARTFALLRHLILHAGAAATARPGRGEPALERRHVGRMAGVAGGAAGGRRAAAGGDLSARGISPPGGRTPPRRSWRYRRCAPGTAGRSCRRSCGPRRPQRRSSRRSWPKRRQSVLFGGVGVARTAAGTPRPRCGGARDRPGGAGGPSRPAAPRGEGTWCRPRRCWGPPSPCPPPGHCRVPEATLQQRPGASPGCGIPLRDPGGARAHLHLQARVDPRGGLRQSPAGATAGAPRSPCGRPGNPLC